LVFLAAAVALCYSDVFPVRRAGMHVKPTLFPSLGRVSCGRAGFGGVWGGRRANYCTAHEEWTPVPVDSDLHTYLRYENA
jgi:hypothetical protein